jgi:hypothetical protein
MSSDYEAKLRYEARHRELMNEARGGWLLRAAPVEREPNTGRLLKRAIPLAWVLVAAALMILVAALAAAAL